MRHLAALLVGSMFVPVLAGTQPAVFSHADWNLVLDRFVDDRGLVDYEGLTRDRKILDRYVETLGQVGPQSRPELFPSRNHALAYYINAYNALVFRGIVERGEDAVWGGLIPGLNFFVRMKVVVDGKRTNLRKLEKELVVEQFADPRVHAALNCASLGCPRLPREAFDGESLDERLDAAMREFVNDENHCRVDHEARTVGLSKIFDWYKDDFLGADHSGRDEAGLIAYVNRYRQAAQRIPAGYAVEILEYDKRLNRQ